MEPPRSERRSARAAAALSTLLALAAAATAAPGTWDRLGADARTYEGLSAKQREAAASEAAGFGPTLFDLLSRNVRRDDRIFFQVPHVPYGTLDLHDSVAALGRFYLLPAVQVSSPSAATVVISYRADPSTLPLHVWSQIRIGEEIIITRLAPR